MYIHVFFNALKVLFLYICCRNELFDIGRGKTRYGKNKCTCALSNAKCIRRSIRRTLSRLQLLALNFFASFADAFLLHEYSGVHYGDAVLCHCCLPEQPLFIRVRATKFWNLDAKRGLSLSSRSIIVLTHCDGLNRMRDRIVLNHM